VPVPVETKTIRQSNNFQESQKLTFLINRQIDALKNAMSFANLKQYSNIQKYFDGSIVKCTSVFGQVYVNIFSSVTELQEHGLSKPVIEPVVIYSPSEPEPPVVKLWLGVCTLSDGQIILHATKVDGAIQSIETALLTASLSNIIRVNESGGLPVSIVTERTVVTAAVYSDPNAWMSIPGAYQQRDGTILIVNPPEHLTDPWNYPVISISGWYPTLITSAVSNLVQETYTYTWTKVSQWEE
jgi:hypothetical protein